MADPELVHEMISVVKFKYQSEDKREEIEISVQQIMEEDYALYVWPSAKVLAEYIWTHNVWNGKRILEIGAGTCLPGLVAAACGASVFLSDRHDSPRVLTNMKVIVQSNNPIHLVRDSYFHGQSASFWPHLGALRSANNTTQKLTTEGGFHNWIGRVL